MSNPNRPTREDLIEVQDLIQGMLSTPAACEASSETGATLADYVNACATLEDRLRLAFFMALTAPTMDGKFTLHEAVQACPRAMSHVGVYLATRDSRPDTIH